MGLALTVWASGCWVAEASGWQGWNVGRERRRGCVLGPAPSAPASALGCSPPVSCLPPIMLRLFSLSQGSTRVTPSVQPHLQPVR